MEVLESVRSNRKTLVKSGHGVGKTNVAATVALWFLYNFPNSIVLTTAPTVRQVEAGLWKEIALQMNPTLGGKLTHLKLSVVKDTWFAMGFTARQSADAEQAASSMQGFHAPYILIIFDEAAGVLKPFWTAANSLLANDNARMLVIGNPTSPAGQFYEASKLPTYNKITISCFEHPNVLAGKEIIPGAVTRTYIEEAKTEWGEDSPLWQSRVLGEFPTEGKDTLISLAWAERACRRERLGDKAPKVLAVDVARFGNDRTVLFEMFGSNANEKAEVFSKQDTHETEKRIIAKHLEHRFDYIVIDDGGIGGGLVDSLRHKKINGVSFPIVPFNFAGASTSDKFTNLRAQAYWKLREDLRKDKLKLYDESTLVYELTSLRYEFDDNGRIKIESKKSMGKRGLRSPDYADAVVMANWVRTIGESLKETLNAINDMDTPPTITGGIMNKTF